MRQPTKSDFRFWRNWGADFRYPYFFLVLVALAAAAAGIYHYLTGDNAFIQWLTNVELNVLDATLREFTRLLVRFEIPINGYAISETYEVTLPLLNITAAYVYLAFLALALVFYLAIASLFGRKVYLGTMVLLMLFLATFNLDLLGIFSETNKYVLIITLAVLVGITYGFQAFWPNVRFTPRVLILAGAVLALGAFIFSGSVNSVPVTALHLVNYASVGTFIASILFIILVSYENILALLWVNSQATNPANRFGLWQFILICLLYLLNLGLLYFRGIGVVTVDLFYIDAFVVLFASSLVGLWGLRQREQHYHGLFSFAPGAAILYLVLATLTFLNIGYAFATSNDPMIAAYHDLIVYTHLAFGTIFFAYVLINYGGLIKQKLRVYMVVYDPKQLPFYTVYVMGTILLVSLLFRSDFYLLNQTTAGYYNLLGDLYKASDNNMLAERFYAEGQVYENNNRKSNYSLAGIYREQNRPAEEANALKGALVKRPSAKVYVRLANLYGGRENFFEQLYILQQGLQTFPNNSHLLNNLAMLYTRTSVLDSVAYYYDRAQALDPDNAVIQSNRLSFLLQLGLTEQAASLAEVSADHLPLRSNSILLHQIRQDDVPDQQPAVPIEQALRPEEFALFYHTHLRQIARTDTAVVRQIDGYLQVPENSVYDEDLVLLRSAILQYNGDPASAKATLENLIVTTGATAPYYRDVLGLMLFEQKLYPAAAHYFAEAKEGGYGPAALHHPYALALAHRPDEAIAETRPMFVGGDSLQAEDARYLFYLLHLTPAQALTASDSAKVAHLELDRPVLNPAEVGQIIGSVTDPTLQPEAALQEAYFYVGQNNLLAAQQALDRLPKLEITRADLVSEANLLQADIWRRGGKWEQLGQVYDRAFTPMHRRELVYYQATAAEAQKKSGVAKDLYDQLVATIPYHEPGMLAAANFYRTTQNDTQKAYDILLAGIIYNRFSVPLYQAYILQAVEAGFESFALNALADLRALVSPGEFATFKQQVDIVLEQSRQVDPDWQ